ncbi:GntR family transcriptional regulator [Candidatus Formimonas warabiya]|uniref:HTH gntR-type domain-containing protein n=1 Tax=Formimonas warabiya TaxID=1761012 RepID=A0A3G1KTV8_FORW1|nr:GntR family transcriptional regulator [Candidatus Formimonas warabiya]ATW25889.1 hypothetical protein DCMF_14905 [Candidatus Formimonas warabiya]
MKIVPLGIDRNAPEPLYYQLKQIILNQISQGIVKPGDLIPAERELIEIHQVSRMTVRLAIQELVQEGYLVRQQGKGTFVAQPKIRRVIGELRSFSEDMSFSGRKPGSTLLDLRFEHAVGQVCQALKIGEGEMVWVVERLRTVDNGEPLSYNQSFLKLPEGTSLTIEELKQEVSLWALLARKGIHLTDVEETVQAIVASRRQAELLKVNVGDPLLVIEGVTYSEQGVPIEYSHNVNRADRFKYFVKKAHQ